MNIREEQTSRGVKVTCKASQGSHISTSIYEASIEKVRERLEALYHNNRCHWRRYWRGVRIVGYNGSQQLSIRYRFPSNQQGSQNQLPEIRMGNSLAEVSLTVKRSIDAFTRKWKEAYGSVPLSMITFAHSIGRAKTNGDVTNTSIQTTKWKMSEPIIPKLVNIVDVSVGQRCLPTISTERDKLDVSKPESE